jgi:hypothetical protein
VEQVDVVEVDDDVDEVAGDLRMGGGRAAVDG